MFPELLEISWGVSLEAFLGFFFQNTPKNSFELSKDFLAGLFLSEGSFKKIAPSRISPQISLRISPQILAGITQGDCFKIHHNYFQKFLQEKFMKK